MTEQNSTLAVWGEYGQNGMCPNCGSTGHFGAEDQYWIYPTAAPTCPPRPEDYKVRMNWRCWHCSSYLGTGHGHRNQSLS